MYQLDYSETKLNLNQKQKFGWVKTDMGGPNAPVSIDKSIEGMTKVIDRTDIKDTGRFLNYDGTELPW